MNMKRNLSYTLLGVAGIIMTACGTSRQTTEADLSGEWNVIAVDGSKINIGEGSEQPYIAFDTANGRISGSAGCNRMTGVFDTTATSNGHLDMSKIATTRMMCPDMQLEQSILQACGAVSTFKVEKNGDLALCNADGKTVLTLAKREAEVSVKALAGKWTIVEVNGTEVTNTAEEPNTMTFDMTDNSFSCQTNCNTINGSFSGKYIDIRFNPGMMTRMACPDTSVEDGLTKVLPEITFMGQLASGNIGFYNAANDLVLILAR